MGTRPGSSQAPRPQRNKRLHQACTCNPMNVRSFLTEASRTVALPDSRRPARQPTSTCERGLSLPIPAKECFPPQRTGVRSIGWFATGRLRHRHLVSRLELPACSRRMGQDVGMAANSGLRRLVAEWGRPADRPCGQRCVDSAGGGSRCVGGETVRTGSPVAQPYTQVRRDSGTPRFESGARIDSSHTWRRSYR